MNIPEREQGQGLVEYALLIALIAIIVLAILTLLGSQIVLVYARVAGGLQGDVLDVANADNAVLVAYEGSGLTANGCNGTISDVVFVVVDGDGRIITDAAVSATLMVDGLPQGSVSGTAGPSGLATDAGSHSVSGNCTNITLE
ncbi:MAG: hypothetical protein HC804_13110 [Anaerolineae bacterium]|nr:hypothetical protein [Anaerolineae bacterium]